MGQTRRHRCAGVACPRRTSLVLAAAALLICLRSAAAQPAPLLRETEAGIAVRTPAFTALISPANGGRVTSLRYGGVEMTRICPDGHGGLFEERHTADFSFSVVELIRTEAEASVTLSADAGDLRVVKKFLFSAEQPLFSVQTTFENRSQYPMAGSGGPVIMNLVQPAGVGAGGRHLYCLNRGGGTEVLTKRVFLTSAPPAGDGVLRWIAVSDPASRRAIGFALQGNGAVPVPARKTSDGALLFGWSYPLLPPGRQLTTELTVIPCSGFSAIAELNRTFVVETLPAVDPGPLPVRFDIMSVTEPLRAVSVITRAYDAGGRELAPCDPVLIPKLEPGTPARAEIGRAGDAEQPGVLLHEVYSEGRRLGAFGMPLDSTAALPAEVVPPEPPPPTEPVPGYSVLAPGERVPVRPQAEGRGFVMWQFDGRPATTEASGIEVSLGEGDRYTIFLGVRALRDLARLRFAVAGTANDRGSRVLAVPPGSCSLWQVEEGGDGAFMTPARDMTLAPGQCVWLALTVDARGVRPRPYAARLVADADGAVSQVPLSVQVVRAAPVRPGSFGLWYSPAGADAPDDQCMAKLRDYGVSCLTVPAAAVRPELIDAVQERGYDFLAFRRGLGGLPPAGRASGLLLLAQPSPLWLIRAGAATPGTVAAAGDAGYAPVLSCERVEVLPDDLLSREHRYRALLVDGGCPMGAVSDLCAGGRLSGDESVWLHVDLTGMHWRRAATELRSAMWAAGWQGLAGVAVTAPPPAREVDRRSVIWTVIRDARAEVARWRLTTQLLRAAPAQRDAPAEQVRALAIVESAIGLGEGSDLRLVPVRRPFHELLRVAPRPGDDGLSLGMFRAAHRAVLLAGAVLPPDGDRAPMHYWDGVPCAEDGVLLWAIAVGEGDAARERALALQGAIERATGYRVPAGRALPRLGRRGPRLVWVVAGNAPPGGWPEDVRRTARSAPRGGLAMVELEGGARIVVVGGDVSLERLTGTFRLRPALYARSRQVR